MTKRQLIDEIVEMNRSAHPDFLARFEDADLQEYLDHLWRTRRPRLQGDPTRYDKYFPPDEAKSPADEAIEAPAVQAVETLPAEIDEDDDAIDILEGSQESSADEMEFVYDSVTPQAEQVEAESRSYHIDEIDEDEEPRCEAVDEDEQDEEVDEDTEQDEAHDQAPEPVLVANDQDDKPFAAEEDTESWLF